VGTENALRGKVALVTGAGKNIGRAIALTLADAGATVTVVVRSNKAEADAVVKEIEAAGGEAVANHDSVSTPEGGAAIVQTALDAYGRVDVVINNAGILRDKAFHNMEPDLMNPVLDVHLKGAFHVTQPAWVVMREQGYGRIVSTSSAAGVFGNFGQTNYGAAKMGLVGFTRVLAVEGAKYNIKANAIAPLALTRMTENIMGGLGDKLDPGLVSPLVAYLAHEDCPVSGQLFSVGGGRVAQVFLGETKGYYKADLAVEDVRDNWSTITDQSGYAVPNNLGEETALFLPFFK
ncbi:MAG TPA: SDR family NAD(P)-dependent oxidoreductase, partial [Ilumatobacteraceae bacterium]|nr:SDR family NAD(P)-dependent oxidoreductase [Ilumatobacteraceae bacterium]